MAITSKTRKELWAKSGNRCAICKKELVHQISQEDGSFIIGDECHIISSSIDGPRYKPGIEDYDSYDNLLLLCKNHHREIDENCTSYTEELLHYIKTSHENRVKETLDSSMSGKSTTRKPRFIKRITSGKELLNIFHHIAFIYRDYDEPADEEECTYIADVFQYFTDIIDIYSDLEVSDLIKEGQNLTRIINELKEKGYYVYAESHKVKLTGKNPIICNACTIILKKQDCEGLYCVYN